MCCLCTNFSGQQVSFKRCPGSRDIDRDCEQFEAWIHTQIDTTSFHEFVHKRQVLCFWDWAGNCPGFPRAPRPWSWGSHIHTHTHVHRNIQAHISTQVRTEIQRVQAQISTQIGQKYKGFPHEHNIQVVLVSRRGRGRASFSIVGGTMLRSLIAGHHVDSMICFHRICRARRSSPSLSRYLSGSPLAVRLLPTLRRFS